MVVVAGHDRDLNRKIQSDATDSILRRLLMFVSCVYDVTAYRQMSCRFVK